MLLFSLFQGFSLGSERQRLAPGLWVAWLCLADECQYLFLSLDGSLVHIDVQQQAKLVHAALYRIL